MNEKTGTCVNYMKEKLKESQLVTKCDTLARHPLRVPGWGRHRNAFMDFRGISWNSKRK